MITIKRNDSSTFEIALNPIQLSEKIAIIDRGEGTIYVLCDAGMWHEMKNIVQQLTEELTVQTAHSQQLAAWVEELTGRKQFLRQIVDELFCALPCYPDLVHSLWMMSFSNVCYLFSEHERRAKAALIGVLSPRVILVANSKMAFTLSLISLVHQQENRIRHQNQFGGEPESFTFNGLPI